MGQIIGQIVDASPPSGSHALPLNRLADYLASVGLELDRSHEVQRFAGGLANLNFLIHVDGKPMVLAAPPRRRIAQRRA